MNEPEHDNLNLFQQLDRMRRAWQHIEPCPGLSKSDFATLLTVAHRGKPPIPGTPPTAQTGSITLTRLASIMDQSLPAVSQRVRSMEESGYVRRVSEASDRRISAVCLTEEGKALLQKAHRQFGVQMHAAMETMTLEEQKQLMCLLEKLAVALESLGNRG